ncbi:hypothetical protein ACFYW8_42040 [Streptomyces sp. NPDC002742]|uniref:hypothetical protein n=1 Tax=Streptomyces sp. NPDC002742 TaxID=3364663 RepID=UPI003679CA8E
MTNLIEMGEREYFAQLAKRTGMFIGRTTRGGATAFMAGDDQAARRHGGPSLDGWRDWLMTNHEVSGNLVREAQIRDLDPRVLGQRVRDTARLTIRHEVNRPAGLDVDQIGPVDTAFAHRVLVDANHSRDLPLGFRKGVDQP